MWFLKILKSLKFSTHLPHFEPSPEGFNLSWPSCKAKRDFGDIFYCKCTRGDINNKYIKVTWSSRHCCVCPGEVLLRQAHGRTPVRTLHGSCSRRIALLDVLNVLQSRNFDLQTAAADGETWLWRCHEIPVGTRELGPCWNSLKIMRSEYKFIIWSAQFRNNIEVFWDRTTWFSYSMWILFTSQ